VDAPGAAEVVKAAQGRAECLLSYHNLETTPPWDELKAVVARQLAAGADICKVVTTARTLEDGLTVLRLIGEFPQARVVAFTMGKAGRLSRVLCPLAGGYFTFAALAAGKESAAGQLTAGELRAIYDMIGKNG
jgi:3-dehydroquinate dehydratase type I